MSRSYRPELVPYAPSDRSDACVATQPQRDPLALLSKVENVAESDWISKVGTAGVAMLDPSNQKIAILPDGRRMNFMAAAKLGYDLEAVEPDQAAEITTASRFADRALDATAGNTSLAKAILQGLPTAASATEVVRPVEPVKQLSMFDRVAAKAKELRAEDRSAKDRALGRTLAYACDVATSHRIDIRQALTLCGVDPSRI